MTELEYRATPPEQRTVQTVTTTLDTAFSGIRDTELFLSALRDFDWLHGAVPGASDLDLVCERYGNVLMLEGKRWYEGVTVPYGQHLLLRALASKAGVTVVLVGQHEDSTALSWVRYKATSNPRFSRGSRGQAQVHWAPEAFTTGTRDELAAMVKCWYDTRKKEEKK